MCITRPSPLFSQDRFYYIGNAGKKQGDFGQNGVDNLNFFCGRACWQKVDEWTTYPRFPPAKRKFSILAAEKRGVVKNCTASYPHLSTMSTAEKTNV